MVKDLRKKKEIQKRKEKERIARTKLRAANGDDKAAKIVMPKINDEMFVERRTNQTQKTNGQEAPRK